MVSISCGAASYRLNVSTPEDFPRLPEMNREGVFKVDRETFLDTANRVARAASRDESRPVLTGILVQFEKGASASTRKLTMAATDSYRLAVKETKFAGETPELEAIVPARAITELARIPTSSSELELAIQDNHAIFVHGDTTLTTRRIDGQFPNHRQLLPESFTHTIKLARVEFLDVVRRVAVMAQRTSPIKLSFEEGALTVSAQTQDVGEASETLPVAFSGEPLEIGFNAEFLREGIESVIGDEVELNLISPIQARAPSRGGRQLLVPDHADPPRGLSVRRLTLRDFRSYERLELELASGLVLVAGRERSRQDESARIGACWHAGRSRRERGLMPS